VARLSQHSLTIGQKPSAVRDKLKSVMMRLHRLEGAPWQELQHERQTKLFE